MLAGNMLESCRQNYFAKEFRSAADVIFAPKLNCIQNLPDRNAGLEMFDKKITKK